MKCSGSEMQWKYHGIWIISKMKWELQNISQMFEDFIFEYSFVCNKINLWIELFLIWNMEK